MFIKGTLIYALIIAILSILFSYNHSIILFVIAILIIAIVLLKIDYKLSICLSIIFVFFLFYKRNDVINIIDSYFNYEAYVIEAKEKYIIVEYQNINFLVYNDELTINKNDIIHITGYINKIEKDLDIDVFEFATYLKNKRVHYSIDATSINIIDHKYSFNEKVIEFLTKNLKEESYQMSKMLLFNDKYVDKISYENLKDINAIHLFVVSGFHISFIYNFVDKILKKHGKLSIVLGLLICAFYVYLLDFSISATRALITLIINKLLSKYFTSLDALSIAGIILLLIEPLNIYSYSYIMSFLITFSIIISGNILSRINKFFKPVFLTLICFVVMIPIQLTMNYEINFISLLTNLILSYVVIVIFILCILSIVFSFINGNIFGFVFKTFNQIIAFLSTLDTKLTFGHIPIIIMVVFYVLFVAFLYLLERKKILKSVVSFSFIIVLMICLYNRHYFNMYQTVTFLNVYQGDCCIVQDSFSSNVMLIDTGGQINYDIASKKIMPYLKYHGIKDIDIVVITHDDYDHNGALESLNNQIEIKQIITDNATKNINLGKITFENLNQYFDDKSDKNDASIVLFSNIGGLNFFFAADISKKIEEQIINDNDIEIDVLKVAHHGSKTSTSELFINKTSPSYAIISVGENNYYGHPNKEVIETLNNCNVNIYLTSVNGTIRFKIKNDKIYFIETAK